MISFDTLLKKALENNQQLKIDRNDLRIKKIDEKLQFNKLYFPKLNWSLQAVDENNIPGPFSSHDNNAHSPLTYASEFSLSYDLFNGFKDYNSYKYHQQKYVKQQIIKKQKAQDMIVALKNLYFDLSLELNKGKILTEQLKHAKALKKTATIRYQKGLIPLVDLERSRLEFLDNTDQWIAQKNLIQKVRFDLAKILQNDLLVVGDNTALPYLDLEEDLKIKLDRMKRDGAKISSDKFYHLYETYGLERAILKNETTITSLNRLIAKGNYYPTLNIKLAHRYEWRHPRPLFKSDSYMVLATLNIPIFDNFKSQANVQKMRLREINAKHRYKEVILQKKQEISILCHQLISLYSSFKAAKEKVALRTNIYQSTLKRYNRGAITIQDLIIDKLAMQTESFSLATRINDLRKSFLKLNYMTGQLQG